MRIFPVALLACLLPLGAQTRPQVEAWVASHQREIMNEFAELLAIPNVASDRENIRRNAAYLKGMLERHGMTSEILETAGNPLVFGERKVPGAARTVLYYLHYDGQPVEPARWKQPDPFRPVMRDGAREIPDFAKLSSFPGDWRLYARSASDDKAPIVALCAALDAVRPTSNVKVILDGEEEAGSPSLAPAIGRYRDKLRADLLVILDGPEHATKRPTLAFGARGNVTLDLTVYGPKVTLHSGHYGNWVPNPAMRLAQLLASMKDEQGRTTIEGFYDSVPPLTAGQRRILRAVPDDEAALRALYGIARPDAVGENLQEALQYPSLNVRGMRAGAFDRTIIPAEASASLDLRLVKETPSTALVEKVLAHIRKQGYHVTDGEPSDADRMRYPRIVSVRRSRGSATEAFRTEMDSPEGLLVTRALERMWGAEPVRVRTMGGTVPISQFIQELGVPAVSLPIVNFDNNQHSDNENLRLDNLWRGIVSIAALLTM